MRRLPFLLALFFAVALVPAAARGQIMVCESWISITQYPPSQTTDSTAYIVVEWGEIQTGPPEYCLEGGTSNFQFTINGADRTGYFSVEWEGYATGTVPLVVGFNELVASVDGYDT
jgi:hypothetical protein